MDFGVVHKVQNRSEMKPDLALQITWTRLFFQKFIFFDHAMLE